MKLEEIFQYWIRKNVLFDRFLFIRINRKILRVEKELDEGIDTQIKSSNRRRDLKWT